MEPFSITCTTCQARLRVRDEAALGQILACPKCGSMVLIELPHDTPSATPEAPTIAGTPAAQPNLAGKPSRTFRFREDFELPPEAPVAKTPRTPPTPAPPKQAGFGPAPQDQPMPLEETGPGPWKRYRQWMLIAGAAVIGVTLALLVVAILSSGRSRDIQESPSIAPIEVTTTVPGGAPDPREDQQTFPPPGPSGEATAKQAATDESPALVEPGEAGADLAGEVPETSADAPPASELDLPPDLAPLDESGQAAADPAPPMPETAESVTSEPPPDPATDSGHGDSDAASQTPTPEDNSEVTRQLAFPLVAIESGRLPQRTTLAALAEFVMNVTTIPVNLDIDRLLAVGVGAETEVEFELRGVTVEQLLTAALEPLGVGYRVQQNQLLIAPRNGDSEEMLTRTYDVSDLAGSEEEVKTLGALIRSMIEAKSWLDAGGDATLVETDKSLEVLQTAAVEFQIARFLDQLRSARGLLPRGNLPEGQIDVTPGFVRAADELNNSVAASFPEPTPLQVIFSYLQREIGPPTETGQPEEAGLRLLIDWQSLAAVGLGPSTTASPTLEEQPLHRLLDNLLAPLQLSYRVVDATTIEIGSEAAILARSELILYSVENLSGSEAGKLIEEIKTSVGEPYFGAEGATGFIAYDPASHSLLVSLPQPQQRALAQWLRVNRRMAADSAPRD